jgi:hypothetical protein
LPTNGNIGNVITWLFETKFDKQQITDALLKVANDEDDFLMFEVNADAPYGRYRNTDEYNRILEVLGV